MSVGFVTASGKGIQISDEALRKARKLFEQLDNDDNTAAAAVAASRNPNEIGSENSATAASCSNNISKNCDSTTSVTAVFKNAASRSFHKRNSSAFKSPIIKNPRLENVTSKSDFNSPVRRNSLPTAPSTPTTPKNELNNTVCGEIGNITPIKLLTPYCKNWRLCVKVTSADEIRRFRGQHVFSFLGVDDSGVEIRVSAFGDTAYKTAGIIRPEQMYYITRASVKLANRRYSRSQHDMEVILRPDSEVTQCTDRPHILSPKVNFEFVAIQNLQNFIDTEIDVLGIIISVGELKQLNSRTGEELQKREIQIVDDSGYCTSLTLWGQKAKTISSERCHHILAAKGVFVRCFQETVSLVTMTSSKLLLDPHIPEADVLRLWYCENMSKTYKFSSTNQVLSFDEHRWIGQLNPCANTCVFNVTAMISSIISENAVYKGCLDCKKKLLVEKGGDLYICPKCGICNEYKYYYTLHMELLDFTGTIRVSAFNDNAQKLLNEEADEVAKFLKFDNERYQSYFKAVLFKPYIFRLSARRKENLMGAIKPRSAYFWSVLDLAPMPFDRYCTFLQNAIEHANRDASVEQ